MPGYVPSRRDFIENALCGAAGAVVVRRHVALPSLGDTASSGGSLDLLRPPDLVVVQSDTAERRLDSSSSGRWANGDVVVTTIPEGGALHVALSAPATAVKRLHLR